jgi:hypothetical protein
VCIARFADVEMRLFPTDHALQPGELDALVTWWPRESSNKMSDRGGT